MDGVLYLMVGTKHAEHLAMSIYTLRKHWGGAIAIMVGDDRAREYCDRFTSLNGVQLVHFDYANVAKGSGSMYLTKTQMHHLSPFDRTIFLDADTLVAGDITNVFPTGNELNITSWMGWVSTGRMMSGRIKEWRGVAEREVERMLAKSWPAINTGVIGFSRKCHTQMDAWHEMTLRNISFICDEIAMQLLYPDYECNLLDSSYNASPNFSQTWKTYRVPIHDSAGEMTIEHNGEQVPIASMAHMESIRKWSRDNEDRTTVRIWHGHGNKFIKKPFGRVIWWPIYQQAIKDNFCGIADWTPYNRERKRTGCKLVALIDNPQRWP